MRSDQFESQFPRLFARPEPSLILTSSLHLRANNTAYKHFYTKVLQPQLFNFRLESRAMIFLYVNR